jgi:hypothetical protein
MSTIINNDYILTLPNELIIYTFNYLDDDSLIILATSPNFSNIVFELLNSRLANLSIRNLMRVYSFETMQDDVNTVFNQLPSSKYQMIKDIHKSETDQSIINAIEILINNNYVEILGQTVPKNMNLVKQIDTIHSVLIADKFTELTNANGGLFNMFNAIHNTVERNMVNIYVNMICLHPIMCGHNFILNISSGLSINKCIISRDSMIVGDVEYDYDAIFNELCHYIDGSYSFNDIKIQIKSIGNNTIGHVQEVFI